jgi:hypothetical protein
MTRFHSSRIACIFAVVLAAQGAAAPAAAKDAKKYNIEKLVDGPYYMRLERIVVPKIHDNTVAMLMTYILVVEFTDPEARDRAKLIMPKLMDAYMRDLHILTSRSGAPEDGIDLAVAKRYLMASGARILGADAIKDVLIERTIARKAG